jgi:hypothetical protein
MLVLALKFSRDAKRRPARGAFADVWPAAARKGGMAEDALAHTLKTEQRAFQTFGTRPQAEGPLVSPKQTSPR